MGYRARLLLGSVLLLVAIDGAAARTEGTTRREQQLAACADDMARLCAGNLSESKKLKTCIRPHRASVSPKCRAWLDVPE